MRCKEEPTYTIDIHIAGDRDRAAQICREFCFGVGLCVTVAEQTFIYTGGEEAGVKIGLVNYPRFPSEPGQLWATASALADALLTGLCQHSVLLLAPDKTVWLSRRAEPSATQVQPGKSSDPAIIPA